MNKGIAGFLCFAAGGAFGYFVASKVFKNSYKRLAQNEMDSFEKAFKELAPAMIDDWLDKLAKEGNEHE